MGIKSIQHPDTHLPICLSAGRVSATFYMRPFGYGLLVSASVRPHRSSVGESDSLTCDHLSNRPSYCQNNPYNDETFDEFFHTAITYLFGAVAETLLKLREKPLHFCKDFFSLD